MAPGRFFSSVCVMMVCILGTTRLSSAENCPCPNIPKREFTLPSDRCFQIGDRFRYQCIEGYVRKAGTSNLIKCETSSKWSDSSLVCIPNPAFTQPPKTTDGSDITTVTPSWLETSPSHQDGRMSASEDKSSVSMNQRILGTKNMTTVQSHTVLSFTHSPSIHSNMNSSFTGPDSARTVGIIFSVAIPLFAMSGIIFLLNHRRKRQIPTPKPEEMQPMNKPELTVM